MLRRVTLHDVADYAEVSVTTVSNVVRDWPHISHETREKVQRAIHELGYIPHPIAQGLRTGLTQVIGFIAPSLADPYFASMVSVAEDVARQRDYSLHVFNTCENENREVESIRRASQRLVDGLLIAQVSTGKYTTDVVAEVNIPVVAIDRIPEGFSGPSCRVDNLRAGELVMGHLYELNHRKIAHLAGPSTVRPARERLEAYQVARSLYGLTYERIVFVSSMWDYHEGHRAMQQILDDDILPTAIFASNDRMAIGASHAIQGRGLRVPQDISVVGVDDIEISEYLNPPLTTVHQPIEDMARSGIDLLLRLLKNEVPDDIHRVLQPSLVVRQSSQVART
ncbi:MAG: substrate-binding domain-containing protein [Chitinophagaceae bacterium]|nr:substrate-binding domain-containing protein [Anaerolineae bacterium]